jgi:hypothetical protein
MKTRHCDDLCAPAYRRGARIRVVSLFLVFFDPSPVATPRIADRNDAAPEVGPSGGLHGHHNHTFRKAL